MHITFLVSLLSAALLLSPAVQAQDRSIAVDARAVQGPLNQVHKLVIGAGRANEGLRADWQQQLAEIKRDAGFRYIRMHGLPSDDMGVYKVDVRGKEQYNFQYIDALPRSAIKRMTPSRPISAWVRPNS